MFDKIIEKIVIGFVAKLIGVSPEELKGGWDALIAFIKMVISVLGSGKAAMAYFVRIHEKVKKVDSAKGKQLLYNLENGL